LDIRSQHAQRAAWAAADALATADAAAIGDGEAAPGVGTHVDLHRAIIGADAALHATLGFGHHLPRGQGDAALALVGKEIGK
jgi:hypothetical protein